MAGKVFITLSLAWRANGRTECSIARPDPSFPQKIWSAFGFGVIVGFLLGVTVVLLLLAQLVMSVFF